MTIAISKEDIFLITEVMNSRDEDGIDGYLERKTGKVLTGNQDYSLEILPNEEDENYQEAEAEFELHYLPIPQQASTDSYQDMVAFIKTVEDEKLRHLLEVAIQGKGAFGRFKDVLRRTEYESEQNRWFSFSEQCNYNRALEWLAAEGFSVEV